VEGNDQQRFGHAPPDVASMSLAPSPPAPESTRRARSAHRTVKVPPRIRPARFSRRARRTAFALSLLVLFALIPALTYIGARAALDDQSGRNVSGPADAAAPGYQALVTPTPTALLLQVGSDRSLDGVTLLAAGGGNGGGGALFIPPTLLVDTTSAAGQTLVDVFAEGGPTATSTALRKLFRMSMDSVTAVDPARWTQLVGPAGSLTFENSDGLSDKASGTTFPAGRITLAPTQVATFLALRNSGEDEIAHLYRHQLFWQAWMAAVAKNGGADVVPGEVGSGLGSVVRAMARGPVQYATVPIKPPTTASSTTTTAAPGGPGAYQADMAALPGLLAQLVPFPSSGDPGDRVKVRLLDGRGDRAGALSAASALVPAGAAVTVFGNADRFTYDKTEVRYYNPARQNGARAMATAMGAGEPILQENQTDTVDVTVIVGRDFAPMAANR
jgi:hypothetical protein